MPYLPAADSVEMIVIGLVGPSHNYAGLSLGNVASAHNAGAVSNPRAAALQSLDLMRALLGQGQSVGILLPLPRPRLDMLSACGFTGPLPQQLSAARAQAPGLLAAVWSASAMWAANAGTVSPAANSAHGRVQISAANLMSMLHRSLEHTDTSARLRGLFGPGASADLHSALPATPDLSDEGAANHMSLSGGPGQRGVEVFVYGREASAPHEPGFPARQSRLAGEVIARRHGLDPARTVHLRQSRTAIDAGAFHNDVVAVSCLDAVFYHEDAFADGPEATEDTLRAAARGLFTPQFERVNRADVPLTDAIRSYLFNSQLFWRPGAERLTLLVPAEVHETASTARFVAGLPSRDGPIGEVVTVDVRESMRNGGGPACLRLRIPLTGAERAGLNPGMLATPERLTALEAAITATYRDRISPEDLADPSLVDDCARAVAALEAVCGG
jgi:succinylarginine dihydrolase